MDIERERVIEIIAAVGAVGLMIGVMMWVGAEFPGETPGGDLSEDGGMMLVGSVIFFVILMAVVGVVLAYTVSAQEAEAADETTEVEQESVH